MALDTQGYLLEGIRTSTGNNSFTFPPRSIVTDQTAFDASTDRAEYLILIDTADSSKKTLEIADPDLRVRWSKNTSSVTRFDYDGYSRRFMPLPGSIPDEVGSLSNVDRISIPVPDLDDVTASPFFLYVGSPTREITFTPVLVSAFGTPSQGTVEIHRDTGELNFNDDDELTYGGRTVLMSRQNFFARNGSTGSVGDLPQSSATDYRIFLNPQPGTGQTPRVRIGYRSYLTPVEVANEASLGSPASGTFQWTLDTGRVKLADADVDAYVSETVYYDGVLMAETQFVRNSFTPAAYPSYTIIPGAPFTDSKRFIVFAESSGQPRVYFTVIFFTSATSGAPGSPSAGNVLLDGTTGALYFSPSDLSTYSGWTFYWMDSRLEVENGASVQFYRSGANGSGESRVDDFYVTYEVGHGSSSSPQLLEDGLGLSPLVMLPVAPTIDDDLEFTIAQGPGSSGRFTGSLVDGTDPTLFGYGYLLDLDVKQFRFSNRKQTSLTLLKASPSIKLDDAALSERGFEASKDGTPLIPGTDFDFDAQTGLIEFTEPVGENDPDNMYGVSGTASSNTFTTSSATFSQSNAGMRLLVSSGDNEGLYEIVTVNSSNQIVVRPSFVTSGTVTADVRATDEIVADRIWTEILPSSKKFSIYRGTSPSGPFTKMDDSEYELFYNVGQINLKTAARPGEAFQIEYVSLDSEDEGVTTTPTDRTEMALFRIMQEDATFSIGSKTVTFNSEGHTVSTDRDIVIYVAGVTQDTESFQFTAPGTVVLRDPVEEGPVTINYWVEDAAGGETTIDLQYSPVDFDPLKISEGDSSLTVGGDRTTSFQAGGAVLIGDREVMTVKSSSYDSGTDFTTVTFNQSAASDGEGFKTCDPIDGTYAVTETSSVDVFTADTNVITVAGNRPYRTGMIVTMDDDPYRIAAVEYVSSSDVIKLTTTAPARRNYIISTLTRTVRPVFNSVSEFETEKSAHLEYPFTLVKMGGVRDVLIRDVDYILSEGGAIMLTDPMESGQTLHAMYVARTVQDAGSQFTFNYAYAVVPDDLNGMAEQRLYATYNLYAPDTFFFRVESVESFIPEIADELSSSSQTGSGPPIQDRSSLRTKDYGDPSPYFDEQHYGNVDVVTARLLKFYNDLINTWEDVLSNLDGRVVGGTDGRFRFDGNLDNPDRASVSEVTNDIDDRVVLYYVQRLVSLFPFNFSTVPVYGKMGETNKVSRIFPTEKWAAAALNDKTTDADFGQVMGSFEVENILAANPITTLPSGAEFTSVRRVGSDTVFTLTENGNVDQLVPAISVGEKISVYTGTGIAVVTGNVTAVTSSPDTVTLDVSVSDMTHGSLLRSSSDSNWRTYMNGRDLSVDPNSGQIVNVTVPIVIVQLQEEIYPNEIVKAPIAFGNPDLQPLRIPALDGEELTDDGLASEPRLRRLSESRLLELELESMGKIGSAKIPGVKDTLTDVNVNVSVGDVITFTDGPNSGASRTVDAFIAPTIIRVSTPFVNNDATGSTFEISSSLSIDSILDDEIDIIDTNVAQVPPYGGGALIGNVDSEITSVTNAILSFGKTLSTGTGSATASSVTWTDSSADFVADEVQTGDLLYVVSGSNRGLYLISSVLDTTLDVDSTSPFTSFPATASSAYHVISPWSFLNSSESQFSTRFLRETLQFLSDTEAWKASPTASGKITRIAGISSRQTSIASYIDDIGNLLGDGDSLYDTRYLWIQQRTDREDGTLVKKVRAEEEREKTLEKIVTDQKKLLITQSLV